MASRLSRTLVSQLARPALRSSRTAGRRMMSTEGHAAKGSDMPWIIGSAVVFGPLALYLLTPPSKSAAHKSVEKSLPKSKETNPQPSPIPASEAAPAPAPETPVPTKDDEGNEVPASEVEASTQAAINEDSPKDAQAAEEANGASPSAAAEKAPAEQPAEPSDASAESTPEQKEKPESSGDAHKGEPKDVGAAADKDSPQQASKEA